MAKTRNPLEGLARHAAALGLVASVAVGAIAANEYSGLPIAPNSTCREKPDLSSCLVEPIQALFSTEAQKDVEAQAGTWEAPLKGQYEIMTYVSPTNGFAVSGYRNYFELEKQVPGTVAWFSQEFRPLGNKPADFQVRAPFDGATRWGNDRTAGDYVWVYQDGPNGEKGAGKFMCLLSNLVRPSSPVRPNNQEKAHEIKQVKQGEVIGIINREWKPPEKVTGVKLSELDKRFPQHANHWGIVGIGCVHIDWWRRVQAAPFEYINFIGQASLVPLTSMVKKDQLPSRQTAWGFFAPAQPSDEAFAAVSKVANPLLSIPAGK